VRLNATSAERAALLRKYEVAYVPFSRGRSVRRDGGNRAAIADVEALRAQVSVETDLNAGLCAATALCMVP